MDPILKQQFIKLSKSCYSFNYFSFLLMPFLSISFLHISIAEGAEVFPPVDCVINPYKVADISSAVPGVLDAVQVRHSDWVEKGNVLATLESSIEQATVALAQARAEIDSEVQLGQVNLAFDEKRQVRIEKLHDRKVVSFEISDEANREVELSTWELQQARDLKKVRNLELLRAQAQLNQKTIRAPFDGFILEEFKSEGEYVEDQAIVRIAQFDPLLIEAIVPMELFGKINKGMLGMVYSELDTDNPRQARVVSVDRMGDAASRTFGVRLELPNPKFEIPAGLKCEMKFMPPP
jgi:RND family efflux transporter MFP subunit